jgi:hypothetical protein
MEDVLKRELRRSAWRVNRKKTLDGYLAEKLQEITRGRHKDIWSHKSDLTPQYFKELWEFQNGKCHWTGLPIQWDLRTSHMHPLRLSVDRLDASIGYMTGNLVLTTNLANCGRKSADSDTYKRFLSNLTSGNWPDERPLLYVDRWQANGQSATERVKLSREHRRTSVFGLISDAIKSTRKIQKSQWSTVSDFDSTDAINLYQAQNGLCYWTNTPLSVKRHDPTILTFERLDRSIGYTKGNLVLSCSFASFGRGDCPADEYRQILTSWLK